MDQKNQSENFQVENNNQQNTVIQNQDFSGNSTSSNLQTNSNKIFLLVFLVFLLACGGYFLLGINTNTLVKKKLVSQKSFEPSSVIPQNGVTQELHKTEDTIVTPTSFSSIQPTIASSTSSLREHEAFFNQWATTYTDKENLVSFISTI